MRFIEDPHGQSIQVFMACFLDKNIVIVREILFRGQKIVDHVPVVKFRSFHFRYAGGGVFNHPRVWLLLIYDYSPPSDPASFAGSLHQSFLGVNRLQKAQVMLLVHTPHPIHQTGDLLILTHPGPMVTFFHRQKFPGKSILQVHMVFVGDYRRGGIHQIRRLGAQA